MTTGRHPDATAAITASMEDYLCGIYRLQQHGGQPVANQRLARALGVTPASTTAMVKRLAQAGLVEYAAYHGCRLTPAGEQIAVRVIRRHRLLEAYLTARLGMRPDDVHTEADQLEHALSETVSSLIAAVLGHPSHDPHGAPIPVDDGRRR